MLRYILFVTILISNSFCFSDVGKWDISMHGNKCNFILAKSLFKGSQIFIMLHCGTLQSTNISVSYFWTATKCSPDYFHFFEKNEADCARRVERDIYGVSNETYGPHIAMGKPFTCDNKKSIYLTNELKDTVDAEQSRDIDTTMIKKPLFHVDKEGIYLLKMTIESNTNYNLTVHVDMISSRGYLSAAIWPLLPFFGIMCGGYTVLCTCWLLVCWLQWRDLLRIQFWIGGVALLGMVESATYYAIFAEINRTGYFNANAYIFAELVSVAKRALSRMLVIIVSLGFGIVKPRLGPALQRVLGTGILWGLLAAIEAWLRLHHKQDDSNRDLLLSEAPLSLLDSAICWWVFVSLAHTMRTLQLRRNTIKLSLYRHFTNTLIFAVISSVIFMLYSIKTYRVMPCITEWKEVWVDEAYWHILFACVLAVIMILWRPTNNNQRYAFTPLLDNAEDDDDEEDQFVNDAYGVKMRGTATSGINVGNDGGNGSEIPDLPVNSLDADLRWVEENIPASTLPLLDSDEEIINTKFEVSKMQ